MSLLKWLSDNIVQIMAALGTFNVFAQAFARFVSGKGEDSTAHKVSSVMTSVASLGMQPIPRKVPVPEGHEPEGDDEVITV